MRKHRSDVALCRKGSLILSPPPLRLNDLKGDEFTRRSPFNLLSLFNAAVEVTKMFIRSGLTAFLLLAVWIGCVPCYSPPNAGATDRNNFSTRVQDPGVTMSTTRVASPDGSTITWNLTGHYQKAGRTLNLHAITVVPSCQNCGINPGLSPSQRTTLSDASDSEHYYSESEMSSSDGTVEAQTVYQYDEQANRNTLSMTVDGVTFTTDIDTPQEIVPVSDADKDKVATWLSTDEGQLVVQAAVALADQGTQEPDNEALLTYFLLAMMVGDASTSQAILQLPTPTAKSIRSHHAVFNGRLKSDVLNIGCSSSIREANRLTKLTLPSQQSNCFGCCGPGCHCIPDLLGRAMYATPCQQHDDCTRQYGYRGTLTGPCTFYFWMAMQYVIFVRISRH